MLALVILGFMLQRQIRIEPATIAIFGAAVLLLLDNLGKDAETQSHNVHSALSEAEWITLMFFLGLFVLVYRRREGGPASASWRRASSTSPRATSRSRRC